MRAIRAGAVLFALMIVASAVHGAEVLSDDDLAAVTGDQEYYKREPYECSPDAGCSWDPGLDGTCALKQVKPGGHCVTDGYAPACECETANDCYRTGFITDISEAMCLVMCDFPNSPTWGWTSWSGERTYMCDLLGT